MTLVKCTQLTTLPDVISEERNKAILQRFQHERAGWPIEKLQSILLDAQHNDVFDGQYVGQVTNILRRALQDIS